MAEALSEAVGLLREAVAGLTKDACFTCGSEPGCNINCAGCDWVARARRFLAAAEGVPCADCGRASGHEPSCISELARYLAEEL